MIMVQLNRNLARCWNPIRVAKGSGDVRLRKKLFSGKHTAIKTRLHCPVRSG